MDHLRGSRDEARANKEPIRTTLADVAIQMFTELGYDNVTMAEVAAGVSRRTASRYFPTKDDLVVQHPPAWLAVFDESITANADQPLDDRIRIASHAVAAHIESNPEPVRQLFGLAFAHPAFAGRYAVNSAQWIDRLADEIQHDNTIENTARMLAAAVMGIINTACEIWATTHQPFTPLLDEGLNLIALSPDNHELA